MAARQGDATRGRSSVWSAFCGATQFDTDEEFLDEIVH